MADNGDSASTSSFATSDNNLFLSTSMNYSTDSYVAVLIMGFLIHMSVLAGKGAPRSVRHFKKIVYEILKSFDFIKITLISSDFTDFNFDFCDFRSQEIN